MGRLKKRLSGSPVHQRKIEIHTYSLENQQLIVEGRLTDDRLVTGYHWDGRPRPPGVVHRMIIRLLIGDWPPTVLEAEAEMLDIPHELCTTVEDSIQKVVGVSVSAGFSDQIRQRLGGIAGCSHLTHLILAMGPAVLHGYWTQHSRQPRPVPKRWTKFKDCLCSSIAASFGGKEVPWSTWSRRPSIDCSRRPNDSPGNGLNPDRIRS